MIILWGEKNPAYYYFVSSSSILLVLVLLVFFFWKRWGDNDHAFRNVIKVIRL